MKKGKNRKKALTVVGAVVVAGLTPGIIAATPGCLPVQASNAEITAAQVVAIDGRAYGFDELFAMQHPQPQPEPQVATRYGVRPPTAYGVRPTNPPGVQCSHRPSVVTTQERVLKHLMAFCDLLIDADKRGLIISPESDLTRELGMTENELKALRAEIKERYGVEVSYHRFYLVDQLNNLRLVSEYIYNLKSHGK